MIASTEFDPIAYINEPRWQASRLGLERIKALLDALGRPQDSLSFVHVAGTNGKGSTCAYLSSICRSAGLKTGLFTSPYIEHFEERIQIDGVSIPYDALKAVTYKVRDAAELLAAQTGDHPTEFELMCAVALTYFAQERCDIVVLEVGLGGRLDSTNVIDRAEVDVITRIDLDHTVLLGDTLEAIAAEKAAIIKPGADVVSAPQTPEVRAVIEAAAQEVAILAAAPDDGVQEGDDRTRRNHVQFVCEQDIANKGIHRENEGIIRQFSYKSFDNLQTKLLASYQMENAALALEAALALRRRGWQISDGDIRAGIAQASWPGRFEVISPSAADQPALVVDGGHNPQGARALAASLRQIFPDQQVVFVMSVLADKDYDAMIEAVGDLAKVFVAVTPNNPRALTAAALEQAIRQHYAGEVREAQDYDEALALACASATGNDLLCFFGSLYAVADIKQALRHAGLLGNA